MEVTIQTRKEAVWWHGSLAVAFVVLVAPRACGQQSTTITGRVLNVVESAVDQTNRFLLAENPVESLAPGRFVPITARSLVVDSFDGPRRPQWQDVVGSTHVESGQLVASEPRNVVVFGDTVAGDVRVSVEGDLDAVVGIVVHYRDPQNYVLAFVTPAFKITGYHEVVDGNFGPWIEPVSTGSLSGSSCV